MHAARILTFIAVALTPGCALLKHLSQYDRIYAVEIHNTEGAGVKASLKLSKKPSK